MSGKARVNHLVLAKTFKLLQRQPVSPQDLSNATGIHLITAQRWLRKLKAEQAVHIAYWLPDSLGRDATPVYALGYKEDTPRKKMPRSEIMQRYRERHAKPVEATETF